MSRAASLGGGSTSQKYLGRKGLIIFLAALSAFPALSTDLYLPALPGMTEYFHVREYLTNLTLILFFVVYAVAVLFWGPFSDRFGRRPILLVGLTIYAASGLLCAIAANVYQLMLFRIFQALGTAAASAIATAIVRDVYRGRRQEVIIAVIQSMTVLSPAVAPVIGALILRFTSWRGAFVAQAILGLLVLAGAIVYQETVGAKLVGNPLRSLGRLVVVLRNRRFVYLLVNFSLMGMATMAFIASSSYIYEVNFGTSSQVYSYFFMLFAVSIAVGAQLYVWLSRRFSREGILTGCFAVAGVSGLLLLFLGSRGPWTFMLTLLPAQISFCCTRPPAVYLMLAQHEGDSGSLSSLMGSFSTVMGTLGIIVVSLGIWGRVEVIGALTLGLSVVSGVMWLIGQSRLGFATKPRTELLPERRAEGDHPR
jgi:DHA1 family bicyclomycin/chloramphenicol resistance-like MFS transporter